MSISTDLAISEAQLEEFFVQSCDDRLGFSVLARQMRINCGIVDVFCYHPDRIFYVVELKAEPLKSKHLAQVLSYVCELRAKYPHKNIRPLLIGPSVEDAHLQNCLVWLHSEEIATGSCEYRLFSFDALKGIGFGWANTAQLQSQRNRQEWFDETMSRLEAAKRVSAYMYADTAPYQTGGDR